MTEYSWTHRPKEFNIFAIILHISSLWLPQRFRDRLLKLPTLALLSNLPLLIDNQPPRSYWQPQVLIGNPQCLLATVAFSPEFLIDHLKFL